MNEPSKHPTRVGLPNNVRHLVSIAALASAGRDADLARYVRTALQSGVPDSQIREVFLQVALLAGFPRAISAFEALDAALASIEEPEKPSPESPRESFGDAASLLEKGRGVFERVYAGASKEVLAHLGRLHPLLPEWILTSAYGLILSRPGLSLVVREYVSVSALAVLDQGAQLLAHMRGALQAGGTAAALQEVVSHLSLHLDESQAEKTQRFLDRV